MVILRLIYRTKPVPYFLERALRDETVAEQDAVHFLRVLLRIFFAHLVTSYVICRDVAPVSFMGHRFELLKSSPNVGLDLCEAPLTLACCQPLY